MHGLQTVTNVRERAPHDHAHRVIEIRAPHLVFYVDRDQVLVIAGRKQTATARTVLLGQRMLLRGGKCPAKHCKHDNLPEESYVSIVPVLSSEYPFSWRA